MKLPFGFLLRMTDVLKTNGLSPQRPFRVHRHPLQFDRKCHFKIHCRCHPLYGKRPMFQISRLLAGWSK